MPKRSDPYSSDFYAELKRKGFIVYEIKSENYVFQYYDRKEFYKICVNTGNHVVHYAERSFETDGTILFFGNPHIPFSWKIISENYGGYCVLFSEEFFNSGNRHVESLQQSPLFKFGGTPIFNLNEEQGKFITTLFQKMLADADTGYAFKDDLIRNYIQLIIHEALKMQPAENYYTQKNAAERITSVFLDLLDRQFPVDSSDRSTQLKTAQDFANSLAVHVNHLNRSVKEITGKSTTTLIAERTVTEAKSLLLHTDWTVAEIAYNLGFEYPSHFNNYFKRETGTNPSSLRAQTV